MSGEAASNLGLKKIPPYWHPYRTMAKGRWVGREILEMVSTEFRDRSLEYYVRNRLELPLAQKLTAIYFLLIE
jgi:hypothetical protein